MNEYKDLNVWQKSKALVVRVYELSKTLPDTERYGLIDQMCRSAISIPSNIAEGCGRNHAKDTLQFLFVAKGSTFELETLISIACDLKYLTTDIHDSLMGDILDCKKMLSGLIGHYREKMEKKAAPKS